jgi:hypothetical protein
MAKEDDRPIWLQLRWIVYTDCSDAFHEEDINIWLKDPDKECFLSEKEGRVGYLKHPYAT